MCVFLNFSGFNVLKIREGGKLVEPTAVKTG